MILFLHIYFILIMSFYWIPDLLFMEVSRFRLTLDQFNLKIFFFFFFCKCCCRHSVSLCPHPPSLSPSLPASLPSLSLFLFLSPDSLKIVCNPEDFRLISEMHWINIPVFKSNFHWVKTLHLKIFLMFILVNYLFIIWSGGFCLLRW